MAITRRVLVLGAGGREHSICWKLNNEGVKLYASPGNGGISQIAECLDLATYDDILRFVLEKGVDTVIVGPEQPLVNGVADMLGASGVRVFGPSKRAAQIESSKAFAKGLMKKYSIPTANSAVFDDYDEAARFVRKHTWARVVKADGLAGGKGVFVCESQEEAINKLRELVIERKLGDAANRVVIEERLPGEEVSFLVFCDGDSIAEIAASQDHKALLDDDQGPNTGGMGAYSPLPHVGEETLEKIRSRIIYPTVAALKSEGVTYKGVLYAGIMLTPEPKVLEFNCRFGDPENQATLPRLTSRLIDAVDAVIDGRLHAAKIQWSDKAACCIVIASGGYPGKYEEGLAIEGIEDAAANGAIVFHAGTRLTEQGFCTNGGRVLGVTALGADIHAATRKAYEAVKKISFRAMHYRNDIASRAIKAMGQENFDGFLKME
ncbi:phosphoribosylamine--glycine ligase [Candidatus Woesearchaeota archaeon CG08_land_8_20_14_0_20_47_9]|nr:MAG: phosphoribosylamine--glycine ligase [Candidatus Woesearchaeota archaeon CG08_land_8_20_14_0_20_47_9]HII30369.1 phosphoribosylamine--glycine ligase [Candidatus Woesearchaeota archaeon]